jgi:hypothetical protein
MKTRHLAFGIVSFIIFTAIFLMAEIGTAEVRPRIRIETITAAAGTTAKASIFLENYPLQMGGFDFTVAYDKAAMTITDVTAGAMLSDCDWELFTHQNKDSLDCQPDCSGRVRIVAMAETANGPYHPSCFGPSDTGAVELAVIHLQIADTAENGTFEPIRFFWRECTDDALATTSGSFLILDGRIFDPAGGLLWDEADDVNYPEGSRPLFVGTPDSCLETEKGQFICGDANGDGKIDVGDAVFLVTYVFRGGPAPDPIEMGDVNGDGVCNIGDSVYLVAYIFRGGPAPVCLGVLRIVDFRHGGVTIP